MHLKKCLFAGFFCLIYTGIIFPVFSQSENTITSVRVSGLTRTKQNTAEKPLQQFIGIDANELDTDQVIAAIMDQGILEPLSVTIEDSLEGDHKVLVVEVNEKWTLFPVPLFIAGSDGVSGGLFLLNANAFGLNHTLAAGGIVGENIYLIMGMYMVPPGDNNIGWSLNAIFSDGERRDSNEKDDTLRLYKSQSVSASGTLQYRINNILSSLFRVTYTNITLMDSESSLNEPDSGIQLIQLTLGLSARRTSWDGVFLSEESASFRYGYIIDFDSPVYHSLTFRGTYEKSLIPGFRISARSGAKYNPNIPPIMENRPGDSAVNIYPIDFSARHYAGLSLGLEKSLFQFNNGTISALGAWQMSYSDSPIIGERFDYGGAFSLHFYMSRLAIPAVGFGIAYNIPAGYFQFSFNMGMSF